MGVVYRARDLRLDLDIALKRIRPDRFSPQRREILRRELLLSRRVTHENVCRVYDLVELDGDEFVSMEFLPGRTLKDIEDEERMLPVGRGLSIAKGIRRASPRHPPPRPEARERHHHGGWRPPSDGLRHRGRERGVGG
jgi:serine/threonine protein kinase